MGLNLPVPEVSGESVSLGHLPAPGARERDRRSALYSCLWVLTMTVAFILTAGKRKPESQAEARVRS